MNYDEIRCPKCKSDEFEYSDEDSYGFGEDDVTVYFQCSKCNSGFSVIRNVTYDDIQLDEEIREDKQTSL